MRLSLLSIVLLALACNVGELTSSSNKQTDERSDPNVCAIAAAPASVQNAGEEVSLIMQIASDSSIGEVQSTSIDGEDLKSTIGGSVKRPVNGTSLFVGKVTGTNGESACSVAVPLSDVTAPGSCLFELTSADYLALALEQDKFNVENTKSTTKALENFMATKALKESPSLVKKSVMEIDFTSAEICNLVNQDWVEGKNCVTEKHKFETFKLTVTPPSGDTSPPGTWLVAVFPESDLSRLLLDEEGNAVIAQASAESEQVEALTFKRCECEVNSKSDTPTAGTSAIPPDRKMRFEALNLKSAESSYRKLIFSFETKTATFRTETVPAPAGRAKPKCPFHPQVAT